MLYKERKRCIPSYMSDRSWCHLDVSAHATNADVPEGDLQSDVLKQQRVHCSNSLNLTYNHAGSEDHAV